MSLPEDHWRKIVSTNGLERADGEIEHRTQVVGAILLAQDDAWAEPRGRRMTLETIAPSSDDQIVGLSAVTARAPSAIAVIAPIQPRRATGHDQMMNFTGRLQGSESTTVHKSNSGTDFAAFFRFITNSGGGSLLGCFASRQGASMTASFEGGNSHRGEVALRRAASALKHNDREELVAVAAEISALLSGTPQLVEPLMEVVDRLGDDPRSLGPAILAARYVAHHAAAGGDLRQRALARVLEFARALSMHDLARALEDMRFVADNAAAGSDIERDAVADWSGQLFQIAVRDPALAIAAARSTADGGSPGALLEQEAVRSWSRQIGELARRDPLQAFAAARYAADYATPGRALERSAVTSVSQQIDEIARKDMARAIEAAREAARFALPGGAMKKMALSKESELLRADSSADRGTDSTRMARSTSRARSETAEGASLAVPPKEA